MKSIFPYFDAEYSYSHHIYEEYTPEMRTALAFGLHDDHIISLSNLETFEKIEINAKGGKCRLVEKIANILQRDQPNQWQVSCWSFVYFFNAKDISQTAITSCPYKESPVRFVYQK